MLFDFAVFTLKLPPVASQEMAELRRRKNVKKRRPKDNADCPPVAIKSNGASFWRTCSVTNVSIAVLVVLSLLYYRVKIYNAPAPLQSTFVEQMDIEEMVKNRKVLPFSPAIQSLYHREIGSSSDVAQRYFDQSMVLSAAFNHDEAIRSLQFALVHDVEFQSQFRFHCPLFRFYC